MLRHLHALFFSRPPDRHRPRPVRETNAPPVHRHHTADPSPPDRPPPLTRLNDSHQQLQSPFVARLPAELRLSVYRYALGQHDVLHLEPADATLKHSRCFDRGTDKLGFRHRCWGVAWTAEDRARYGYVPDEPQDKLKLLSLVRTCRLIYFEAIDLLYTHNTFDLRRAESLVLLAQVVPRNHLSCVRSLQFSTAFECPLRPDNAKKRHRFPPDDFAKWTGACAVLQSMECLSSLTITLSIWARNPAHKDHVDDDSLFYVLEPLKAVRAKEFSVTMTTKPSDQVMARLGHVHFHIFKRERPGIGFYAWAVDD